MTNGSVKISAALIDSEQKWAALRNEWDHLVATSTFPSAFLTFDYLLIAFRTFHAADSTPFLIVIRNGDGELIGIAPLRRSKRRHRGLSLFVLEYVTTWEIDKPYIIARIGFEDHCWNEIFRFLHGHSAEWDLLDLIEVPDSVRCAEIVPILFRAPFYRCSMIKGPDGPIIDLTMPWTEFLHRHEKFAKSLKRLAKLPDGYEIVTYDVPENIASGMDRYMQLEAMSWKFGKHGLRKNRWHLEFYRDALHALSQQERAAIRILMSGDELVAGIICWEFADTVYIHHTVYNPKFAHLSPGTMFMGLVIGEYMNAGRFKFADLLCGFADFYKPWARTIVGTSRILVYRLSVKTRFILLLDRIAELTPVRSP